MRIVIIEYIHFQYAITCSRFFGIDQVTFLTSKKVKDKMLAFDSTLKKNMFVVCEKEDLSNNNYAVIEEHVNQKSTDIVFINPIFDSFQEFSRIAQLISCQKILTIHNINNWFYPRFRSLRGLRERNHKQELIKNCNYIAVEDFIYSYLKTEDKKLFNKHKFIYIPFTINTGDTKQISKEKSKIKIVLPGSIDKERRSYRSTITAIKNILAKDNNYIFSFAGIAIGEYGKKVHEQLDEINKNYPGSIVLFKQPPTPEQFAHEMNTADVVLSTSTTKFSGLGTTEIIGKTKPTAAIHDMITYQLPGFLPSHLEIPKLLKSSSFSYSSSKELVSLLKMLNEDNNLYKLQEKAAKNSLNFTPNKILERNPYKFNKTK